MASHTLEIQLRHATPDDLMLLKSWDSQPHTIVSDPNDDWHWEIELHRRPDWRQLIIAELDGMAIGFMQIIDPAKEDSRYWGEVPPNHRAIDIWIGDSENLGKGYGTVMMKMALDRCFAEKNVTAVLIDPLETNTRAHRFYERIGFQFVEKRQFGEDQCLVYEVTRTTWENKS